MSHDEPLITNPATEEDEDEDDGGDEYEAADEVKDEEDDDREEANDEMKYWGITPHPTDSHLVFLSPSISLSLDQLIKQAIN